MGLFDSLQDIIGGASDIVKGPVEDVVGGITDNPVTQGLQDGAATITDGATDAVTSATDQGQTAVEDISSNFGL